MNVPQKIDEMMNLVITAFAKKKKIRIGPVPLPASIHSLRVGLSLLAYGYPLDTGLAGLGHDLYEDTDVTYEEIRARFGERVASLILNVSWDPAIGDNEEGKREMFMRVYKSLKNGDADPLAIECADNMDNLRNNSDLPVSWQGGMYEWGVVLYRHLKTFTSDIRLASDYFTVLQYESKRLCLPL